MTKRDINTAARIREAARKLFTTKGFGRTTTRDIAAEAGINLALVNYHFRSKEELFHEIMFEVVQGFMGQMQVLLNDDQSFEQKVEVLVDNYIRLLNAQPELPIFMLSEMRNHPRELVEKLGIATFIREAEFFKELAQRIPAGISPIHFFMNLLSITVFPFVAKPMLQAATDLNEAQFASAMEARKKLIPLWFKAMLQVKP